MAWHKKLLFLWKDYDIAIKQTAKEMFAICLHAKEHISSSSAELFILSKKELKKNFA